MFFVVVVAVAGVVVVVAVVALVVVVAVFFLGGCFCECWFLCLTVWSKKKRYVFGIL